MNTTNKILLPILIGLVGLAWSGFAPAEPKSETQIIKDAKIEPKKEAEIAENTRKYQIEAKQLDVRAQILASYFAKHNSPLQYHAQDFIDAASEFNVDWKLVPAIAGVESTFGKHIPGGFNAWGWGVYGTQAKYFTSWRDGIFTVTRGLRENYINKGYTEPYSMNRIYASSPYWGGKVSYFMADISKHAQEYNEENRVASEIAPDQAIAVNSAVLVNQH